MKYTYHAKIEVDAAGIDEADERLKEELIGRAPEDPFVLSIPTDLTIEVPFSVLDAV